jgi:hypothetical protein
VPEPENKNEQESEETAEVEETEEETTEEETEETETQEVEEESEETEEEHPEGDVPDWVKEKISKVNNEAKSLRDRLRETEDKLKDAKTPEEVEAIVKQMTKDREDSERALLIENVALKYKLPEQIQKRLTGTTREELEADAKELADLFGTEDEEVELEGGLSPRPRSGETADDPRSLAAKHGHRARR